MTKIYNDTKVLYEIVITKTNSLYNGEIESNILNIKRISPNKMQINALASLDKLRLEGKNKALLISATGTGKTYLSAFDALKFDPRRLLFIIHRENIAKAAMTSYKTIFGYKKQWVF